MTAEIRELALSPDEALLASASDDRTVRIWDLRARRELHRLSGHGDGCNAVAFSPDGARLASGGDDRNMRIWDVISGEEVLHLDAPGGGGAAVAFSADGKLIAARGGGRVHIWRTDGQLQGS